MNNLSSEEVSLLSAKSDVADVVDVCVKLLTKSAEENDWDLDWFIKEFRTQFNQKLSEFKN